jgi:Zn-dependent protease
MAIAEAERTPDGRVAISLFRIGGIEIRLDYSWFFIFLLVLVSLAAGYFPREHPNLSRLSYWTAGAFATLLFFASVLLHELSHAWMARASGIRVSGITLFLFGGASELADEPSRPSSELRVAIVGPLTSFALAVVFWVVHLALQPMASPLSAGVALYLAWINAALGIFNLLPGLPLDGGRILRALAWWRTGSLRRATRLAATAGRGVALGLMVLGGFQIFAGALIGGLWLVLIGLFLRRTAEAGYQNLIILQSLEDVRVRDVAIQDPVTVTPQMSLQTLVDDYFLKHGYRSFPVVEGARVQGLISIDALRQIPPDERHRISVKHQMTPLSDEIRVAPDLPLADALKKLPTAHGGRLLVLDGDELVGLLTKEGLARFLEIRHVLQGLDTAGD